MYIVVLVSFWAIASGVVTAGLLASFYKLVTNKPVTFQMLMSGQIAASVMAVPLLALSGPVILARNAVEIHGLTQSAWKWLAGAALMAALWGFITGVVVLEFLLRVF